MTTRPRFGFPLEYVSDIDAARRFYVDVLGYEVDRAAPTFVQLKDGNGASFAIATDESMGGTRDLELYWLVDDAEESFKDLARKAEVSLPLKQMPFGKVFAVKDPDGRPRYVLELAQDRPSQPV